MDTNELIDLATKFLALINAVIFGYFGWKKFRPEVRKLEIDVDSDIVDAANLNLQGAKISAQMLLDRINELKIELESERTRNREERAAIEKARQDDAEYFRRRIKDVERESADLRLWAAKLVKQVVEAGQIPVPFLPSYHESDSKHTKPRPDLEAR